MADVGSFPSLRCQVLMRVIEGFDVGVFDCRTNVCEPPGDAAVVTDDDVGMTRQADSGDIETCAAQMHFVPEVGHLMAEVHVIREQRLARDRVCAGDYPVVRSYGEDFIAKKRCEQRQVVPGLM